MASKNGRYLYRVGEVAQLLALSRSKVYDLIARGELESVKVGSARRVTRDAIRRFLQRTEEAG